MCPDYVWVPEQVLNHFVEEVLKSWRAAFPQILTNPQYTSVINERHFERITALINDATARGAAVRQHVPAGEPLPDRAARKIAPTVLTGVASGSSIETDEIFGPVLVVYPYRSLGGAIDHINSQPHPLTIYWYRDHNEELRDARARNTFGFG
ncbi:MAG: hypothetical protein NVS4B6_30080 [Mycobacterium sp.]